MEVRHCSNGVGLEVTDPRLSNRSEVYQSECTRLLLDKYSYRDMGEMIQTDLEKTLLLQHSGRIA